MIISRRYVPFVWLFDRDPYSREVLEKAYSTMPDEERENHWRLMCSARISINTAEMGSCIPNLGYIREEFERLDHIHPYDNGLSLENANKIYLEDQLEEAIHIRLANVFDGEEQTIGFAVVKSEDILPHESVLNN